MECRIEFTLDPLKQAEGVKQGLRNKALRIAMNKAAAVVKAATIAAAPARHGYLKKAIRIRVKNYKNSDTWVAIVGPSSSVTRKKGKRKRGKFKGTPIIHKPANYARLVEKGHGGKRPAPPHPFLAQALEQTAQQYITVLQASIKEQIEQLLASQK